MKLSFKLLGLITLTSTTVLAGSLDSSSPPTGASSAMYSIQSLCDRLQTGTAGSQNVFTEPTSGPGATGCTLNDVMNYAPTLDNINGATPAEVIAGKTFWGLRNGDWGVLTGTYNSGSACVGTATLGDVLVGQTFSNSSSSGLTGTMTNNGVVTLTPSTTPQTIVAGYHNGSGTVVGDADLVAGNLKTGINLFGVVGTLIGVGGNVQDTTTGDAVAGDILVSKKAWVDGIEVTGTVPAGANVTGTAGNLVMTIPDGLYSGSKTATANDADLTAGNIRFGVNLFGVSGDSNVVNTNTGDATATDIATGKKAWVDGLEITGTASGGGSAAVPKTGQTTCYDNVGTSILCAGTGQDGDLQKGVTLPSPRFTNNTNGTVTDNLTGLIWLKNANCFGLKDWTNALSNANALANSICGLTDGSTAGQWRLPNPKELYSLIDLSKFNPALSTGHPFTGVQNAYYWSASSYATVTSVAWVVYLNVGGVGTYVKTSTYYVWPVRGGQ